ncbi:MAG: hypothetical protein PHQ19_05495, partial [Candidatus Krumholzibacteria bacterium]|nr:hypothetical protein [Candidatus Krumholzibacteria bacterium]
MNRPWGFFWCNAAALAASLLTGLQVLPAPGLLGILLAFHALFILPGIVVWRLLPGGAGVNVDGVIRVFLTGLAVACSVVCIGFMPRVTYQFISSVYAFVTAVGLIGVLLKRPRAPRRWVPFPGRERTARSESRLVLSVFALLFVICFILLYGRAETGIDTDAPDHLSYIRRSLDSGELLPRDSFYRGGDGAGFDQRKGLWHPVATLWAGQAAVPPEELWSAIPAIASFFAVIAFWGFAGELVGGVPMKLLALTLLLLVYRGEGAGWLSKLGYSRNIAMIVAWGTFMMIMKYLRGSRRIDLASAALWSAAGTAIHSVFGLLAAATLLSLSFHAIFTAEGRAWRRRLVSSAAAVSAAVALPALLRLLGAPEGVNVVHRHMQGMLELGGGLRTIDPVELVMRFDLTMLFACAVTPFVFFLGRDRARERLVATLFAVPALLALVPFTATVLERFLGYFYIR